MASRRASLLQRSFAPLIFGGEKLTLSLCLPVYNQLERDPGQVSRIITDEDLMLQLLSNFNQCASRIAQFFALLSKNDVSRAREGIRRKSCSGPGIADEIVEGVLFPLLSEDFQRFQLTSSFLDLFTSVIDFCLPFRPRPLETMAKKLSEKELLLGALVSGESSTKVMKEWISVFRITIFDSTIIGGWTRHLIARCRCCESDHGVSEHLEIWEKLDDLIGRLTIMLHNYPRANKNPLPSLGALRKLTTLDKKSNATTKTSGTGPELPPEVKDALQHFRIPPFNSERALVHAIKTLENSEMLDILLAIVESFPCRPCYEVSINPSAAKSYDLFNTDHWGAVDSFMFTELLGNGIGTWRVLVSSQALNDLEDAHIQGDFIHVGPKLIQLASGDWLRNLLCKQIVEDTHSTLHLAQYASDKGILWQKDVGFDEGSDATQQLVKIWRIGDIKMISQAIPQVISMNKSYPPARLEACKKVSIDKSTGENWPISFPESFDMANRTPNQEGISGEVYSAAMFQFYKFYMVTQTTIDNILSGNANRGEYPLVLSREELDIVKNSTASTLILGRSGTGKTTCLVYKLFSRYLVTNHSEIGRPKRQVLLTRSSVLANKLEMYTKRLISTQHGEADESEDFLYLTGQDDDREVNDTVFSLKEGNFPLVCSFSHFMKLLENTVRAANRKDFSLERRQHQSQAPDKWNPSMGSKRTWQCLFRRPQVVDFEVFSEEYWPSFPSHLTKGVSATLAFMEIIGVIKGSAWRSANFSPLLRDEYQTSGYKISPVSVNRDVLYDIYQRYETKKHQFGDIDDIDRARLVLDAISNNQELKKRIEGAFDEIYVDEIQDQRLLEIIMLLHLIKRPDAIHLAGDTAQSISKDSVFRFQNVKDLLFEHFSLGKSSVTTPPHLYKLHKNYRTHQGILSVATSVMRQLYGYFPHLVDSLPDEVAEVSGPKPTVFVGFDATIFSSRMFGAADLHDDSARFGAEQVIIVRDFAQKTKLKEVIGDFALILTIMESKGMEFEDVLLYDFFATSECISGFRVLANLPTFASFDGTKHIALCSELKQLYVAITRAQNRLWFFEKKAINLAPMLSLWTANEPVVEVAHFEDSNIQEKLSQLRPGSNADPEVWSAKGHEFIHKKDYQNYFFKALFCFGRAEDRQGESLANAFIAEKKGKALLAKGDEDRSEELFRTAIKLFHQCGHPLREAACYETLRMFKEAADIFSHNREFGRASDLYNKIDSFEKAAWNYSRAQRYNEGVSSLARGNLFDNLVHYLNDYGSSLDSGCRLHYSRLCNLLLKRGKISPELSDLTVAALRSDTEKEEFFLEYEMTSQLSTFYIGKGRYSEACDLAMRNGNPDEAWEVNERYGGMNQLPQQKRTQVFNYIQARYLLANLAADSETIFQPDVSWDSECAWLLDDPAITDFWGNLKKITNALWNHKIAYTSISFSSLWMKQIFDIIVTFKADVFVGSAKAVLQLPIESVNEVLRMAREMIAVETIPASLLIFLRIFPTKPETKHYTVLKSSPLFAELNSLPSDRADIIRSITRWVLSQVCAAVDMIDAKAVELYNWEDPCVSALSQAVCRRPQGRCRSHLSQATSAEFSVLMHEVLAVNTIFHNLLLLYHLRFGGLGPEEYSKTVRPRRRKWLEFLLSRITYVSSLEQEPGTLARVRREISWVNSPYPGIFGELQNLLFHRLRTPKDWDQMCDFSSMLEQLQVAESLGVLPSFKRCLGPKAYWGSSQSRNSWEALQRIENNIRVNGDAAKILDEVTQTVERKGLYSYHAVASLYENMATSLIYKSNPTDFLLPNGWVEMYLLQGCGPPESSKMKFRDSLLSLIQSFCGLIKKINGDIQFSHKLSGRQRSWDLGLTVFVRRNVDFLLTCVLNASAWRTSQGGQRPDNIRLHQKYSQTRTLVFQVFGLTFANAPEFLKCPSDELLAKEFVRSFDRYAGKDSPRIIKARNTVSFFVFLESGVSTILLESLQSHPEPASNEITSHPDGGSGNHTQAVLRAVETIQRIWRTRYRIIQNRREFCKTPSGQAILYLRKICNTVAGGASLTRTERIWRAGVLFSDALEVYLYVRVIEKLYLEKKKAVQTKLENVDPSQMESVQYQWEKIYTIRDRVSQSAGFLSEKNWHELDIPSQDLSWKCREVLRALKGIEVDLRVVDCAEKEVTAAETIQRMWRFHYPLVLKRREFNNTLSGQAILYFNRIYKTVLREASLDRKERIRRAAVFFNEGLDIYGYVKKVEMLYLAVRNKVKSRISDTRMVRVEHAQVQSKKMSQIRRQVRRNVGFMSEGNWMELDISSLELREKFKETLRFLMGVESDLHDIMADDGFFSG